MQFKSLLLASLALFAFLPGTAHATPVSDYLARTLRFNNCSPEQTARLNGALSAGLERIMTLNPILLSNRIELTGSRLAQFDCSADLPQSADAQTELRAPRVFIFKAKRLKVAKLKVKKLFTSAASFPFETIVLHEFLHFLEFDNFDVRLHNDVELIYTNQMSMYDVVYSCAVSAFPVENTFWRTGAIAIYGLQTSQMAETCAAARPSGHRVSVDVSSLSYPTGVKGPIECYLLKDLPAGQKINSVRDFPRLANICQK